MQSSTLKSYISAIKSTIKTETNEKWSDEQFELSAIIKACKLKNDTIYTRLLIGKNLLELMLFECHHLFSSQPYLLALYQALFALTFYGLMWIGELTCGSFTHTLMAKDIHAGKNKNKILIILYTLKTHGHESAPQEIKINEVANMRSAQHFCPFILTRNFIHVKGNYNSNSEPFFIFRDGEPVRPEHMRSTLRKLLTSLNLNASLYGTHSLCIGRTVQLFKMGLSIETIKKIGRWRSNAVYKYLKCTY